MMIEKLDCPICGENCESLGHGGFTIGSYCDRCLSQIKEEHFQNVRDVKIVNLTPHPIVVSGVTFESDGVARVSITQEVIGNIGQFKMSKNNFGQVEGLPEPRENTYYVVSGLVLTALAGSRDDVIGPDTGATARRENGQIVEVFGFVK